jgi:hypothetical protein
MPSGGFTTAMNGGNAENAEEVFCQNCLEQFWTPARRSVFYSIPFPPKAELPKST